MHTKNKRENFKNLSKIIQKSIQNHQKSRFGGVLGGLGGGLGTILRPRAAPKAPETKKVTKSLLNLRSFLVLDPKIVNFDIFAIFVDFFVGRFSEARFGGLRPPILEDYGMIR